MAKLWAKVNGTWVQLGAQDKSDIGLGNVENFTHTNSATDGSSSKYATGAAVKQAYDRATNALNSARGLSFGGEQWVSNAYYGKFDEVPDGAVVTRAVRSGSHSYRLGYRRFSQ